MVATVVGTKPSSVNNICNRCLLVAFCVKTYASLYPACNLAICFLCHHTLEINIMYALKESDV